MTREQRAKVSAFLRYTVLIIVGIIMVYPLIWMVGATFKTNSEIFTSAWFWPKNPVFDGYDNAFKSYGGKIDLIKSMINTYKIVIPKVVFTVVSATLRLTALHGLSLREKAFSSPDDFYPVPAAGCTECSPVHHVQAGAGPIPTFRW